MTDHLIIGVQPEYKIQETPFQLAQRIASTTESFQNKAPDTGVGYRAAAPLLIPDTYQSAAPVSSNLNVLDTKIYLPEIRGSGTSVQGPIDGPTHLINKANLVDYAYNAATINEVNRMLVTENYSGGEVLLGRELTVDEIRNRQLGVPDRYIQAKAGIAQPILPPVSLAKVLMPANASNPPPLPAEAESNRFAEEQQFISSTADSSVNNYEKARARRYPAQTGGGIPFGRFTVHPDKLANGELSMKYSHNGKKISDLPNRKLHPALQQAVHDTIHGQPTNGTGLSDADVHYLHKIVHRSQAGGDVKAGIPIPPGQRNRARMMVILGEMQAGNDNPELKSELVKIVTLLGKTKAISRSEAQLIRRTFL